MTSAQSGAGKSEKTKQKIVTASRDLFAKKGYSETSVRDILEAAEISKGNLYHHFKGKEFLFLHIMEEDHRFMMETWHEEKQALHRAIDKLAGFAELLSQMGINYPLMRASEEFCASAFTSDEVMERLNKIDVDFDDVMRDILLEGNEDGSWSIQHVESKVKILLSVFYGLDVLYKNDTMQQKKELQKEAISLFIHGINHHE
ncbi:MULTISPECIES: TetR/AcrR family transcriptional regulator [Bacillus]|uniref:TetR/AcrR family transcriptional regulator n=1 Tax=Bacillus TaxID=1386 RepID=UPI000693D7C3|nr:MULTISPECIES: TetR/AcrR family transcriptional regulator [Bacillus]KOA81612.1 TetR family transcriptional regulator [Bacillus stratosphericus]MBS4746076.1 TetR family transcriptional regulator [Bacillus altitudinis]MBU4621051.1 TetR/AcrR family transcriptional regulator [Bacillus sp. GG161]MCL7874210.1 TetR/AcrR family transcriptional regulator [Bacillus altitudinis]MDJ0287586.1 TetR family transcriptional regulator C-terminal domain-containing protein [Bacillus altitudinis]